jgi:C-terminal processing protease CtpA/Prc
MSVGEFFTMVYKTNPRAITLGTQTGGADGDITRLTLPGNVQITFSGLGVYFPDGSETQRIGIKPDIEIKPTVEGYISDTDEQLDAAIKYLQK